MYDDYEQRRQDSSAYLDRQYDELERERTRSDDAAKFYDALQDHDISNVEWSLGIDRQRRSDTISDDAQTPADDDGLRLIDDPELERKYREEEDGIRLIHDPELERKYGRS